MEKLHAEAELAPRDIVARAVFRENREGRGAFLDCREAIGADFKTQFPSVYKKCQDAGIDPVREPIPVAPAAHFHMGGIHTDAFGRTTLNGLWACGEVASTGAHGANRLASNSLLEAVVFSSRVANDLKKDTGFSNSSKPDKIEVMPDDQKIVTVLNREHRADIKEMRDLMDRYVGIERNAKHLIQALERLTQLANKHQDHLTLSNMLTAARIITISALLREESRGGHYRTDFDRADTNWAHRSFISLEQAEKAASNF